MAVARAAGAGQGRDRLRLDRQRRHRGRGAGGQGRRQPPTSSTRATWRRARRKACRALGAQVCQLDGNYDQANRACRELSLASGIEFANITLRPFYAEGAKTMAFEVVEQLGWAAPDHFVIPAAGGTLSSRVHKGLNELEIGRPGRDRRDQDQHRPGRAAARRSRPRSSSGGEIEPQTPETAAHSLAIGAPGDGAAGGRRGALAAAARRRPPPTPRSSSAIDLLGATEGILTEPAGGTTIAATAKLAAAKGKIGPDETVVAVISGNGLKTLQRAPGEALAGNGRLRRRDDGARCSPTSARQPRRRAALSRQRVASAAWR